MMEKSLSQQLMAHHGQKPVEHNIAWQEYEEDEISLGDLFLSIWKARGMIIICSLAAAFVLFAFTLGAYFFQEKENVAKQEFKLEFTGSDQHQYPNGMKFSTADILNTEIIDKVYRQNNLERYLKISDFRAGLAVLQVNDRLRMLEYEYSQKFSEKNLDIDKRQRLEQEFLEKKRALLIPVFTLTFIQAGRTAFIPEDVTAKLLQDIMKEWAVYAERVKGANMFQLELVSPNVLKKEDIEDEDYLVATDILRVMALRVMKDLETLAKLPGATVVKVGEQGISISDLRYRVQDLVRFKLNPLLGLIRQTSVSKSPELTIGYMQNQIFDLKLKADQAAANVSIYENSLNQYIAKTRGTGFTQSQGEGTLGQSSQPGMFTNTPAMIPQFGESFLDSLVQMSQQNSDAMFRQNITKQVIDAALEKAEMEFQSKFYEDMLSKISLSLQSGLILTDREKKYMEVAAKKIDKDQQDMFDGLKQSILDLNMIYQSLSRSSLNPEAVLYSLTSPTTISVQRPMSLKKLMTFAVLAMFLVEGVILLTVLARGNGKQGKILLEGGLQ